MAGRRARFFLDTNILVYTVDASAPERRARAQEHRCDYGFYDSLILAAALGAGCGVLYSEGLQNGQQIGPR